MPSFLEVLRARFERKEEANGDFVPWELDDKYTAYGLADAAGYKTPRRARCESAGAAVSAGRKFGKRFLVKQPNRHSGKGIYLLEEVKENVYFDLLTLREVAGDSIKPDGPAPGYWLAEECIQGEIEGKNIPLDYKVYCFGGRPTVVLQIDRNTSPPQVAVFDGAFVPLARGVHFNLDMKRWVAGHHVLPVHAVEILAMAGDLATRTGSWFVSVDCYSSQSGPVFGEFTFAPGGPDVGMIKFTPHVLKELDAAICGDPYRLLSGLDIDQDEFLKDVQLKIPAFGGRVRAFHAMVSACGVAGDKRYGRALTTIAPVTRIERHFALCARLAGMQNGDAEQAFYIWRAIATKSGYINGDALKGEYEQKALAFHRTHSTDNAWHTARAAEVELERGVPAAIEELERLAGAGYQHAIRVLEAYRSRPTK